MPCARVLRSPRIEQKRSGEEGGDADADADDSDGDDDDGIDDDADDDEDSLSPCFFFLGSCSSFRESPGSLLLASRSTSRSCRARPVAPQKHSRCRE